MRVEASTLFATLAGTAILAAIIAGLMVMGWPSDVRMRRLDEVRANDLQALLNAVATYRRSHEKLPEKLEDLPASSGGYSLIRLRDPAGRPYEYAAKDAFFYELCAEFDTVADSPGRTRDYQSISIFSKHERGRQCFELEARPPAQR